MPAIPKLTSLKRHAARQGWSQYIRSEADERAVLNGCRFNAARAAKAVDFFPTFLVHSKGRWAGQPFELLDWQREGIIEPLFGWERADGFRRYRKAYVEIPKKNGKSTIASGVGLYMLCGDGEPGAEVYAAATDKAQAGIVHREACNMVEQSPILNGELLVNRSVNNIEFKETNSWFRAVSAVPSSQEGLNIHCLIADELHAWYGRDLYDALQWGFAARDQPLFFIITTSGENRQSVCYEQHEYALGVNNGTIHDDRFLGYVRTIDESQSIEDEQQWHAANPSLGETIKLESFREDFRLNDNVCAQS